MSEERRHDLPKDAPPPESPRRKLANKTHGFRYTVSWKPGFDDPRLPRAAGTEAIVFDVDIKYDRPAPWPSQVFLAMRRPFHGLDGLAQTFEDAGRSASMLLRHGWTPDQIAEFYPEGTLGRAIGLFLRRCPQADWS